MQTIWILLVQSGLVPGTLLHITHPQHARQGKPLVSEIDLNLDDFPQIQSPDESKRQISILQMQTETLKTRNALLEAQQRAGEQIAVSDSGVNLREILVGQEVAYFRLALERSNGNAAAAARLLNLEPHAFRKRAISHGVLSRKNHKR